MISLPAISGSSMSITIDSNTEAPESDAISDFGEHGSTGNFSAGRKSPKFWRGDAADTSCQGWSRGDWSSWSRHLSKRGGPKPVDRLCKSDSVLAWGLLPDDLPDAATKFQKLYAKSLAKPKLKFPSSMRQELIRWAEDDRELPQTFGFAVECLAVAYLLPRISDFLDEATWWKLVDKLWDIVQKSANWRIDAEFPAEQVLVQQLLVGELPLTLAYLFPEIRALHKLRRPAETNISEGLVELLNGEGLPKAAHLSVMLPLAACWTRCRLMSHSFKKPGWGAAAEGQFSWFVTKCLMLSTTQGSTFLADSSLRSWNPEFLATLLKVGGENSDVSAARALFDKKLLKKVSSKGTKELPESSDHCEWSGLAVMRTNWDRRAAAVAVDYSSPDLRIEVWTGSQRLFSGVWQVNVSVDGNVLSPAGCWEQTCWFSDQDIDFLELTMELSGGVRLDRQIALAREEGFLLLTDVVLGDGAKTSNCLELPLDPAVEFVPEEETREGRLVASKPMARVLPLDLPEWRTDPRVGDLFATDGKLSLFSERSQKNMACPLLIDLDRSRLGKECTWRQLTVAQALEIQPHEVAVGYRAQSGKDQWLVYRSLAPPANRTVLGQNLSVECLVARFLPPAGEVDELLEVEG